MPAYLILVDGSQLARVREANLIELLGVEPESLVSIVAFGEGGGILVPGQPIRTLSHLRWPDRLGALSGRELEQVLGLVHELKQSSDRAEQVVVFQLIDPVAHRELLEGLTAMPGLLIMPFTSMFNDWVTMAFTGRWIKVVDSGHTFMVYLYDDGTLEEGSVSPDGPGELWRGEWSGTLSADERSEITVRIGEYTSVVLPEGPNEMYGVESFQGRTHGRQVWLRLAEPEDDTDEDSETEVER